MHSNTFGIDEWKMRPMSSVDQRVLHYELEDLPNMRIHDLHQLIHKNFSFIFFAHISLFSNKSFMLDEIA